MSLKNRLELMFRGWFPKEPKMPKAKLKMAEAKVSKSKPWWWKPYWIFLVILTIALALVLPLFADVTIERSILGLVLTLLGIGFAYYIRVRPSLKVNRAVYILIGITPIGFVLAIISVFTLNRTLLLNKSGTWPIELLCIVACFGVGALIGDWIGKRRGYTLMMTP
jgi:hypothetical protein